MKVAVIIVTYNAEKWIASCFNSLKNCSIPCEVIVIDNDSGDNTVSILRSSYPECDIIESKVNLGFGKANNIGIAKAYKNGYDYFFLLNQDAYVERDTIERLVKFHERHSTFGILSPIHLAENGTVVDRTFLSYIYQKDNCKMVSDIITGTFRDEVYEFDFINAAIWSISKKCIEQIGGFDPLFSHYGEDVDYCNRVLGSGLKIGVAPTVKAVHNRSQDLKRKPLEESKRMYIKYLLVFKNSRKKIHNIIFIHIIHTLKFLTLSLIKLKLVKIKHIIVSNISLIKNIGAIKKSRREQTQFLAFINKLDK